MTQNRIQNHAQANNTNNAFYMDDKKVIAFYDQAGSHGVFANTAKNLPITVDGLQYRSSEHYFQSQKIQCMNCDDATKAKYHETIRNYNGPMSHFPAFARMTMKNLNISSKNFDAKKWDEEVSMRVMAKGVISKLNQHPPVAKKLLELELNAIIVEATANDKNWGDGNDGLGKNKLGRLYMMLLDYHKKHGKLPDVNDPDLKNMNSKTWQDSEERYEAFANKRKETLGNGSLYSLPTTRPIHEMLASAEVKAVTDKNLTNPNKVMQLKFKTEEEAKQFADYCKKNIPNFGDKAVTRVGNAIYFKEHRTKIVLNHFAAIEQKTGQKIVQKIMLANLPGNLSAVSAQQRSKQAAAQTKHPVVVKKRN